MTRGAPQLRPSRTRPGRAASCGGRLLLATACATLVMAGPAFSAAHQVDVGISECGRVATWSAASPILTHSSVRGQAMTLSFVVNDTTPRSGGTTNVETTDILWSATPMPTPPKIGERTTTTMSSEFGAAITVGQVAFSGGATASVPVADLVASRQETERAIYDGLGVLQPEWLISVEDWRVDLDLGETGAAHTIPPLVTAVAGTARTLDLTHITLAVEGRWNETSLFSESPPEILVPDLPQLLADDAIQASVSLRWDHVGPPAHAVYVCTVDTLYVPEPSVGLGLGMGSLALAGLARRRAPRSS